MSFGIHDNFNMATTEPQCMTRKSEKCVLPPLTQSSLPIIGEEEFKLMKKDLVDSSCVTTGYKKYLKHSVDPELSGQRYYIWTFIPSKEATPDKDGCYGVGKIRGCFPTVDEADDRATFLIRDFDSYNKAYIGAVGSYFPVTSNTIYSKEINDVKEGKPGSMYDGKDGEQVAKKCHQIEKDEIARVRAEQVKEKEKFEDSKKKIEQEVKNPLPETDIVKYTDHLLDRGKVIIELKQTKEAYMSKLKVLYSLDKKICMLDEQFPDYREKSIGQYRKRGEESGMNVEPIIERYFLPKIPMPSDEVVEEKTEEKTSDNSGGILTENLPQKTL